MYSGSRITVAELYHFNDNNQSHGDYGFHERVVLRGYCLPLLSVGFAKANAAELNSRSRGYSPVSSGK